VPYIAAARHDRWQCFGYGNGNISRSSGSYSRNAARFDGLPQPQANRLAPQVLRSPPVRIKRADRRIAAIETRAASRPPF
jgi:hypothetical protein